MAKIISGAYMEAVKARVAALEEHLGKNAEIKNLVGTLRHPFTEARFELNRLTAHEFDGFLLGQLVAGRVIAFIEGKQLGQELPEIKDSPEGSGVDRTDAAPLVEQLIKQPETPAEPDAPETPAEPDAPTEPEAPAPAAKASSILKKAAQ
jgi:hypothetical protein